MRRKKPLIIFIVLSTAAVFFTVLVGMILVPEAMIIDQLYIKELDISKIPDGTYYGTAETVMAAAGVMVSVEDGGISQIDILKHIHSNGQAAEKVLDRVLEEQCLKVDVVSGATTSSLVLLKAVEDALKHKEVK